MKNTFEVSKFDRSNEIKELHLENIDCILVTKEVLKFDKFNDVKFSQLENAYYIFIVEEVSNPFKSKDFNEIHSKKI